MGNPTDTGAARDRANTSTSFESHLSAHNLREATRWIRDDLDPVITREGCSIMEPDTVLALNQLLTGLLRHRMTMKICQEPRIHKAILLIAAKGTRWPAKLIELCDNIIARWTTVFGPLDLVRTPLYGPGGRLERICTPEELDPLSLMDRWCRENVGLAKLSYKHGHVRCQPGDWWIEPHFAFRNGMIDEKTVTRGGITFDTKCAYAILLTGCDELDSSSATSFTYRTHHDDRGRYILSRPYPRREPVRVLRSHKLSSLHSPKVGVRYDGLYRVTGWVISTVAGVVEYDVRLQRLEGQISIEKVRIHPDSEELEDYMEYKRIRALERSRTTEKKFVLINSMSFGLEERNTSSNFQCLVALPEATELSNMAKASSTTKLQLPTVSALRTSASDLGRSRSLLKKHKTTIKASRTQIM